MKLVNRDILGRETRGLRRIVEGDREQDCVIDASLEGECCSCREVVWRRGIRCGGENYKITLNFLKILLIQSNTSESHYPKYKVGLALD